MRGELVVHYVPQRVRERGFQRYRMVFQDLNLAPRQEMTFAAYNEIWFLLEVESDISIRSDFSEYDYNNSKLSENIHEHADRIEIRNHSDQMRKATFIQVILED